MKKNNFKNLFSSKTLGFGSKKTEEAGVSRKTEGESGVLSLHPEGPEGLNSSHRLSASGSQRGSQRQSASIDPESFDPPSRDGSERRGQSSADGSQPRRKTVNMTEGHSYGHQTSAANFGRPSQTGIYEVTFGPKMPIGVLRTGKNEVTAHTVEAIAEVIAKVRIGDILVGVNGDRLPDDIDFQAIMLSSLRNGGLNYKLAFKRMAKKDQSVYRDLTNPPDFFDDAVGWFSYWDFNDHGDLGLDEMVHAICFSFRLQEAQIYNLRRGLEVAWYAWDPAGLGVDLFKFTKQNGLAEVMLSMEFFGCLQGESYKNEDGEISWYIAYLERKEREAGPKLSPEEIQRQKEEEERRIEREATDAKMKQKMRREAEERIAAEKAAEEARLAAEEERRRLEELERQEAARRKLIEVLEQAIKRKDLDVMEKHVARWKQHPEGAPTELLEKANRIIVVEGKALREKRRKEAEKILEFATKNIDGRSGILRLQKALESTSHIDGIDWKKYETIYLARKKEVDKALETVGEPMNVALSLMKSEDLEACAAARSALEKAIKICYAMGLGDELREAETIRKKLHNHMQDSKGSIRVFCRIRPVFDGDSEAVVFKNTDMDLSIFDPEEEKKTMFLYDSVFDGETAQKDIFGDCQDLVESAMDGYNVTIFAYGQTGAGKTHTMLGSAKEPGVSPNTISNVFEVIKDQEHAYDIKIKASMVELYKNAIVDLLAEKLHGVPNDRKIRYDPGKNIVYFDPAPISRDAVNSVELDKIFDDGSQNRKTAFTEMNSDSSRSHLFFIIHVEATHKETGKISIGKITLIDLAGSERLKKSQAAGNQQQEAIEINKSLTALGDVIEALVSGKKKSEVPYRNHKLTQMLQDALGGTSKTLMFVCIRPDVSNADETLMSLKYASRARNIVNKKDQKK